MSRASVGLATIWIVVWWSQKYSADDAFHHFPITLQKEKTKEEMKSWKILWRWPPWIPRWWSESESFVGGEGWRELVVWLLLLYCTWCIDMLHWYIASWNTGQSEEYMNEAITVNNYYSYQVYLQQTRDAFLNRFHLVPSIRVHKLSWYFNISML